MKFAPLVSAVRFRPAPDADRAGGLVGWAEFEFGGVRIDGAQIRRTRSGRMAMYWPERVTCDRRFPIVQPIDRATRIAIEREVLDELRARGLVS
jgi:hypothetical protein